MIPSPRSRPTARASASASSARAAPPNPPPTCTPYVALLRGINVGGKNIVKMDALRKSLEALGLGRVRTLLASGNALFDAPATLPEAALRERIEARLEADFGRRLPVILRSRAELAAFARGQPFGGVPVTPQTRLYITFLGAPHGSRLRLPHTLFDGSARILSARGREVCTVFTLTEGQRTPDVMGFIEKEFGSDATTRNWNTVLKCLEG